MAERIESLPNDVWVDIRSLGVYDCPKKMWTIDIFNNMGWTQLGLRVFEPLEMGPNVSKTKLGTVMSIMGNQPKKVHILV